MESFEAKFRRLRKEFDRHNRSNLVHDSRSKGPYIKPLADPTETPKMDVRDPANDDYFEALYQYQKRSPENRPSLVREKPEI